LQQDSAITTYRHHKNSHALRLGAFWCFTRNRINQTTLTRNTQINDRATITARVRARTNRCTEIHDGLCVYGRSGHRRAGFSHGPQFFQYSALSGPAFNTKCPRINSLGIAIKNGMPLIIGQRKNRSGSRPTDSRQQL